jgi:predicted amidohydrolase YtcJ
LPARKGGARIAICLVLAFIGPITNICSAADVADIVITGGRIYTVDPSQPWVSAVAIENGRFVYAGHDAGSSRFVGPVTRLLDLGGRMAMPGIHDAHTHLLLAGLQQTYECRLPEGASLETLIAALASCERKLAPGQWLAGGLVTPAQFPEGAPHRKYLDAAFPDRPVYLTEGSLHHALVNTRALQVAGIDQTTVDPPGGRIIRDAQGEPTGMLIERATWLASRHIPLPPPERDREAVLWAVRQCNRFGITSVQEASASRRVLTALRALDNQGLLTLEVAAHLIYGSQAFGQATNEDLLALIDRREEFRTARVHPDFVKMWIDGAPLPPWFTSAEMDLDTGEIETSDILIPPAELNALVTRFDAAGLKTKMHVAGHGAAHAAIDAIAAARERNPTSRLRHELGHASSIARTDMARMGHLDIVAEVSPALWHVIEMLGDPPKKAWEFRSLQERDVLITMGTDWVVTANPELFVGLQGMLQREDESLELPEAIRTMTINGAIALGWKDRQGSIEPGKLANLIVLDRNLFEVPVGDIGGTQVVLTVVEGQVVHASDPSLELSAIPAP